eukprot:6186559-Pleurochrysis_carterae.AAC.4
MDAAQSSFTTFASALPLQHTPGISNERGLSTPRAATQLQPPPPSNVFRYSIALSSSHPLPCQTTPNYEKGLARRIRVLRSSLNHGIHAIYADNYFFWGVLLTVRILGRQHPTWPRKTNLATRIITVHENGTVVQFRYEFLTAAKETYA